MYIILITYTEQSSTIHYKKYKYYIYKYIL